MRAHFVLRVIAFHFLDFFLHVSDTSLRIQHEKFKPVNFYFTEIAAAFAAGKIEMLSLLTNAHGSLAFDEIAFVKCPCVAKKTVTKFKICHLFLALIWGKRDNAVIAS